MRRHLYLVLRKITGIILIVLGIVGAFIPIPIVPFFLLIFVGLAMLGIKHPWIDKVREKYEKERAKKRSLAVRIGVLLAGIILFVLIVYISVFLYIQTIGKENIQNDTLDIPKTNVAILLVV